MMAALIAAVSCAQCLCGALRWTSERTTRLAALTGVVHDRQRADGDEHNRDEDNVWRGGSAASQQNSTLASAFRKQACCSSTDQGGGKRRAVIAAFKNCARPS